MHPRKTKGKMPPLPDEMDGSPIRKQLPSGEFVIVGRVKLRPNDPAPERESAPDRRPHTLLPAPFETAEDWGLSILSKKNDTPFTSPAITEINARGYGTPDEKILLSKDDLVCVDWQGHEIHCDGTNCHHSRQICRREYLRAENGFNPGEGWEEIEGKPGFWRKAK